MGDQRIDVDKPSNGGPLVAAITLGSNSFNMLLAEANGEFPRVVAKHKRKVRLAKGLTAGRLDRDVSQQALDCLAWFGQILAENPPQNVAVYATAALRQASDADQFCQQALPLLGYPIEIISGEQEAELIFHGMRATTKVAGKVAMFDIGGASTEVVVGDSDIDFKHSFTLGAVLYTHQFFAHGVNAEAFANAERATLDVLQPKLAELNQLQWQQAMGISGTFRALFELADNRNRSEQIINRQWLTDLRQEMIMFGSAELTGLEPERAPTLAAGIAILLALMTALNLDTIYPAGGALREGVLAQLATQAKTHQLV